MSYLPVWVPYPDLTTVCVLGIANFAVDENNRKTGADLKLKQVLWGAYKEIDDETLKHFVYIETINGKGEIGYYGAEVLVEEKDGKKVNSLIYFDPVYQDKTDPSIFWRRIPNNQDISVEEVARFAVDTHNSNSDDNLVYISTVEGWFYQEAPNTIRYELFIQAKDCFGRVRIYRAVVLEVTLLPEKIRTLEYFKITPRKC